MIDAALLRARANFQRSSSTSSNSWLERRNDGATVGGGEREEHRVGEGGRTRKATGEGRAGKEEDKETQLTTP